MSDAPPPPPGDGSAAVPPPPPGAVPGTPPPGAPPGAGAPPPAPPAGAMPGAAMPGMPMAPMGGGPLGKRRSIGLVILLSIVTCGIWTIVWSYQNGEEVKQHAGKGIGGIGYLFLTLLLSPITMFLLAGEVEQLYRSRGKEPPITTLWGLWFLLPVIGNIIWYVTIQKALNDYWTELGQTNDPGL